MIARGCTATFRGIENGFDIPQTFRFLDVAVFQTVLELRG